MFVYVCMCVYDWLLDGAKAQVRLDHPPVYASRSINTKIVYRFRIVVANHLQHLFDVSFT